MKLMETVKNYKGIMYDSYSRIVDDPKEYEKITRKK